LTFGKQIANGIPGSPPPVPKSKILVLSLKLKKHEIDKE
jgi:hypothetical protein